MVLLRCCVCLLLCKMLFSYSILPSAHFLGGGKNMPLGLCSRSFKTVAMPLANSQQTWLELLSSFHIICDVWSVYMSGTLFDLNFFYLFWNRKWLQFSIKGVNTKNIYTTWHFFFTMGVNAMYRAYIRWHSLYTHAKGNPYMRFKQSFNSILEVVFINCRFTTMAYVKECPHQIFFVV